MQIQHFSDNNNTSQHNAQHHYSNYLENPSNENEQSIGRNHMLQQNSKNQQDLIQQKKYLYEKHVEKLIQHLKFSDQNDRKFIAKSYRKINELLTIKSCHKFYLSNNSKDIPQKVVNYAFNIKAYDTLQKAQESSLVYFQSFSAKRRCAVPILLKNYSKVEADTNNQPYIETQWQKLKSQDGKNYVIHESGRFKLSIQSQPNSKIIYTEQPLHPLLVKPQFRKQYMQKVDVQIIPPKKLNIIVIKPPNKIQSNAISLQVKKSKFTTQSNSYGLNHNGNYNYYRDLNYGGMIRPEQTFDHDLSNSHEGDSSNQNNGHYFSIQPDLQSRSR